MELFKGENFALVAVKNALEINAAADRPVNRVGAYSELLFKLVKQLKRVACLAV